MPWRLATCLARHTAFLCVISVMVGMASARVACAWTDTEQSGSASVVYTSDTLIKTTSTPWKNGTGQIYVANGRVKVWGAGTLTPQGDHYYNNWEELECLEEVDGSLEESPAGYWKLHASYDFTLPSEAIYQDNNGVLENYRAETTYAWELIGISLSLTNK